MDAVEKTHADILEQVKPLKEAITALSYIQKAGAFLTVVATGAVALSHWMHH